MPDETSEAYRWGRLEATLTGISEKLDETKAGVDKANADRETLHTEMQGHFATIGREVTAIGTRLESHVAHDDGRFDGHEERIERLEAGGAPAGVAKPVVAAGGATTAVLVLNWLREFFGGQQPPQ